MASQTPPRKSWSRRLGLPTRTTSSARCRLADLIQQDRLSGYEFVGFIKWGAGRVPQEIVQNLIGDLGTLPSIARKVDLQGVIIAVDEGRIREVGSHEELVGRGGLYSQLYQRQLELATTGLDEQSLN